MECQYSSSKMSWRKILEQAVDQGTHLAEVEDVLNFASKFIAAEVDI